MSEKQDGLPESVTSALSVLMKRSGDSAVQFAKDGVEAEDVHFARVEASGAVSDAILSLVTARETAARDKAIEECATAMHPILRSMISRGEAARLCRALLSQPRGA